MLIYYELTIILNLNITNYFKERIMAFDGIVTKAIASELQELSGARIDKIFQPTKNNMQIDLYTDHSFSKIHHDRTFVFV